MNEAAKKRNSNRVNHDKPLPAMIKGLAKRGDIGLFFARSAAKLRDRRPRAPAAVVRLMGRPVRSRPIGSRAPRRRPRARAGSGGGRGGGDDGPPGGDDGAIAARLHLGGGVRGG